MIAPKEEGKKNKRKKRIIIAPKEENTGRQKQSTRTREGKGGAVTRE